MKRVVSCAVILAVIFGSATLCYIETVRVFCGVSERLGVIRELREADEKERAAEKALELMEEWDKSFLRCSFFVNYDTLSGFSGDLAEAMGFVCTDNDEAEAEIEALCLKVEIFLRSQSPFLRF